jgi:hypothetical protein
MKITKQYKRRLPEDDLVAKADITKPETLGKSRGERKSYFQGYAKGRAEGILIGENNTQQKAQSPCNVLGNGESALIISPSADNLRTLKDMQMRNGEVFWKSLPIEELRQEAIKWVKSDKTDNLVKMWIEMFFNLTSEDLK